MGEISFKKHYRPPQKIRITLNTQTIKIYIGNQYYKYKIREELESQIDFSHFPKYHLMIRTPEDFHFLITNCDLNSCTYYPAFQYALLNNKNENYFRLKSKLGPKIIMSIFYFK